MNIFFVIDGEVSTPALQGSILPGITRDSVLQLGRMWGLKVAERRISIDELLKAGETGRLQEVFGSGTAAVVSPVGQIKYGDRSITVGNGQVGPLAKRFYTAITDIQYGRTENPKGWMVPVV
jgi:branched-chain amino acid aminotransferase